MLTWGIQRVGYADDQVDEQGVVDVEAFLRAFDAFPWAEQNRLWNKTQEGPMAALVLKNEADKRKLWITSYAGDGEFGESYFVAAEWMAPRKSLFGFGQTKMVEDTATFDMVGRPHLEELCRLLADARHEEFDKQVAKCVERDRDGN